MLNLLFTNPIEFFIAAGGLLLSLTVHEFAHAWVADHLGDPTPRMQGRVTLDPRAHLDPLGTLLLLLTRFGWGKPVEIDQFNLKNPVRDSALIAFAGPASNLIIATVIGLIFRSIAMPELIGLALFEVAVINVVLAIFNLVPVFPLDGSRIILALLPAEFALEYEHFMHRYGIFVLLALLLPWFNGTSPLSSLIGPVIQFVARLLLA